MSPQTRALIVLGIAVWVTFSGHWSDKRVRSRTRGIGQIAMQLDSKM